MSRRLIIASFLVVAWVSSAQAEIQEASTECPTPAESLEHAVQLYESGCVATQSMKIEANALSDRVYDQLDTATGDNYTVDSTNVDAVLQVILDYEETFLINPADRGLLDNFVELIDFGRNSFTQLQAWHALAEVVAKRRVLSPFNQVLVREQYIANVRAGNYQPAIDALNDYELIVNMDSASINSDSLLADIAHRRADLYLELRSADAARADYARVLELSKDSVLIARARQGITFAEWDDGNVDAAFEWASLRRTFREDEPQSSRLRDRVDSLLSSVQTEDARTEVGLVWGEYRFDAGLREEAIQDVRDLAISQPQPESLELYGYLLYRMGDLATDAGRKSDAFKYFLQCAQVESDFQAGGNYRAALLIRNDIPRAIEFARSGLRSAPQSSTIRRNLLELLIDLHRRINDFETAMDLKQQLASS